MSGSNRLGEGNTTSPRVSSSKYWFFTWNNYPGSKVPSFVKSLDEKCSLYAFQEEEGEEGTPHLQGKIGLKEKGRPIEIFGSISKKIHWEKSSKWKGYEYCFKDETCVGKRYGKGVTVPAKLQVPELYGWQEDILDLVTECEPHPRQIYWIWSKDGSKGKSALARYLAIKHNALVVGGKHSDMKAAIALVDNKPTICILDIPRCVDHISYQGIEEIKNGIFFSGKYESGMVKMNPPHFVVLANKRPETSKLSKDRWRIFRIGGPNDLLIEDNDIEDENYESE